MRGRRAIEDQGRGKRGAGGHACTGSTPPAREAMLSESREHRREIMHSENELPEDFEGVLKRVEEERARLAALLPEIDPGDLHAILVAIFQPWGMGRRFFVRQVRPGVYVF